MSVINRRNAVMGWAVWNVSFRSERAEGGVPPDAADRLGPAIEAVERLLVAEDGRLGDAATFVAAARMRRIELLTSGVLAEGKDTLPWVLAIAVLQPTDVSAQLMAEWTLRRLHELPAASTEFAVHAGTLATSSAAGFLIGVLALFAVPLSPEEVRNVTPADWPLM